MGVKVFLFFSWLFLKDVSRTADGVNKLFPEPLSTLLRKY